MELIIPPKGRLIDCDECCHLKDQLVMLSVGEIYLCFSCLYDALQLLRENEEC